MYIYVLYICLLAYNPP